MKEIDFLPESYKRHKRRRKNYRRQYIVIAVCLSAMVSWSFFTGRNVSNATAELVEMEGKLTEQQKSMDEYISLKTEISRMEEKITLLESIDDRISVSAILARLSSLVENDVVFSRIELEREVIAEAADQNPSGSGLYTTEALQSSEKSKKPFRYKVTIHGIGRSSSDIPVLIRNMEQSGFFCGIVPRNLHSRKLKNGIVSEFELTCYIANYRQVSAGQAPSAQEVN